jgi:hypothetical protein
MPLVFGKQSTSAGCSLIRTPTKRTAKLCLGLPGIWRGVLRRPIKSGLEFYFRKQIVGQPKQSADNDD